MLYSVVGWGSVCHDFGMSRFFGVLVTGVCAALVLASCSSGESKEPQRTMVKVPASENQVVPDVDCGEGCHAREVTFDVDLGQCTKKDVSGVDHGYKIFRFSIWTYSVDSGKLQLNPSDVRILDESGEPVFGDPDLSSFCYTPDGPNTMSDNGYFHYPEGITPEVKKGKGDGSPKVGTPLVVVPAGAPSIVEWAPAGGSETYSVVIDEGDK